ncbi:MAG: LytR C-terminal domain-containing protein [Ignavibacteriaceae bacterium]|nr:LytR C-terminal domain-containing protein [Ignavibacteriaceae bacterium]
MRDTTQNKYKNKTVTASFLVVFLVTFLLLSINGYLGYSAYTKVVKIFPDKESKKSTDVFNPIKVEVINGCGIEGLGDHLTDTLRLNKIDVIQSGNYYQFNVDKTLIIDRSGNMMKAKKVAGILGVPERQIIRQINKTLFLDITVLAGKDFSNLKDSKEKL